MVFSKFNTIQIYQDYTKNLDRLPSVQNTGFSNLTRGVNQHRIASSDSNVIVFRDQVTQIQFNFDSDSTLMTFYLVDADGVKYDLGYYDTSGHPVDGSDFIITDTFDGTTYSTLRFNINEVTDNVVDPFGYYTIEVEETKNSTQYLFSSSKFEYNSFSLYSDYQEFDNDVISIKYQRGEVGLYKGHYWFSSGNPQITLYLKSAKLINDEPSVQQEESENLEGVTTILDSTTLAVSTYQLHNTPTEIITLVNNALGLNAVYVNDVLSSRESVEVDEGSNGKQDATIKVKEKSNDYIIEEDYTGSYSGGNGTDEFPYLLSTKSDITTLNTTSLDWDKYFVLTDTIDLEDAELVPFGNATTAFTGQFYGNNKYLLNFNMDVSVNAALFGVNSGRISDLNAQYVTIDGDTKVAGFVADNSGIITNCNVYDLSIDIYDSSTDAGGFAHTNSGTITNCHTYDSEIYARNELQNTQGFIDTNSGTIDSCSVSNCTMDGFNNDYVYAAAFTGSNSGDISNCKANVVISDVEGYGQFGSSNTNNVTNCLVIVSSNSSTDLTKGLFNIDNGIITNSYYDATVSGFTGGGSQKKTTAELKTKSTYTNWSEDIWQLVDGYYANLK